MLDDLEDPFFLYCCRMHEAIGLAAKSVNEGKREPYCLFAYLEGRLPEIPVRFMNDVRQCSIDEGVAAT